MDGPLPQANIETFKKNYFLKFLINSFNKHFGLALLVNYYDWLSRDRFGTRAAN